MRCLQIAMALSFGNKAERVFHNLNKISDEKTNPKQFIPIYMFAVLLSREAVQGNWENSNFNKC